MTKRKPQGAAVLATAVNRLVADLDVLCDEMATAAGLDLDDGERGSGAMTMPRMRELADRDWRATPTPVLGLGFIPADPRSGNGHYFWWYTPHGGQPARELVASTQPNTLTYYDPAHSDWWQGSLRRDGTYVTGPYIDVAGTNAYVVTFSRAVQRGDRLAGVVAADVSVGDLQGLWRNELVHAEDAICVADSEGSVIATNSGRLLGGTLDQAIAATASCIEIPLAGWFVYQFPR